ncbi:MAG TPA: hypothetical protein VF701_14390 [Thermoanaerobaculia bacterium]
MRIVLTTIALLLVTISAAAGPNEEMRKLDFLIGEWEGEATVRMGGQTHHVLQFEKVQSKLDGKVLLIEGLGRQKGEDGAAGEVVHNAMAVVSWDESRKLHRFATWLSNREGGEMTLRVTGKNEAVWQTPDGRMRYTIRLDDEGRWYETGEFTRDGEKWEPFIEMLLSKVR